MLIAVPSPDQSEQILRIMSVLVASDLGIAINGEIGFALWSHHTSSNCRQLLCVSLMYMIDFKQGVQGYLTLP